MLENKDEREEVDEPFHTERPLAPFLRPPLPSPELPRLLDEICPLGGALSHTSTRCVSPASTTAVIPAAVVVVATPTMFAATPTVAIPAVATVAGSLFPPGCVPPTLPPGCGHKARGLIVGNQQGLDESKGRGRSRLSGIERTIHASPGRFH